MSQSESQTLSEFKKTQVESLKTLLNLSKQEVLLLPSDNTKYLTYGYLLQAGVVPSALGKLEKVASPDLKYLPIQKGAWEQNSGPNSGLVTQIRIPPGKTHSQALEPAVKAEVQLKYICLPNQEPEIRLLFKEKIVPLKQKQFLSLIILSYTSPRMLRKSRPILSIKNVGDQDLILLGAGSELCIRVVNFSAIQKANTVRKIKRAYSLVKNGEFYAFFKAVYYNVLGKFASLRRSLSVLVVSALLTCCAVSSCVLPPDSSGPRVYSQSEINYIAESQKGISYSQSGRFDRAELNLRTALASTDNPPSLLLGNLGFVLRAQDKFQDAIKFLNQALKLDPHFLNARLTLGRTYFEMGEIDLALKEYLKVENDYLDYWKGAPDKRLSNNFDGRDLLSVYTNLAIMYAQKGMVEESICYSQKALDLHDSTYTPQAHARFLISLEQFFLAGEVLRQVVFTGAQVTAPLPASLVTDAAASGASTTIPEEDPSSIQDIGVVRLLENNLPLSAEAFDRVLTLTIVPDDQRILTEVLRYEVATAQNDNETIELLDQSFSEIASLLCQSDSYVTPAYWPIRLKNRVLERRKLICRNYG